MVETISVALRAPVGGACTDVLRSVVRHMASTNEIIVNKAQGGGKSFLVVDQSTIEFRLDPIMSPAFLTKGVSLPGQQSPHETRQSMPGSHRNQSLPARRRAVRYGGSRALSPDRSSNPYVLSAPHTPLCLCPRVPVWLLGTLRISDDARYAVKVVGMMQATQNRADHHMQMRRKPMAVRLQRLGKGGRRLGNARPQGHMRTPGIIIRYPFM